MKKIILAGIFILCFTFANSQIINTIAGTGTWGYSGDGGPAISAQISASWIAADGLGNLYISDYGYSRIRKIDGSGTITTIAGNGIVGFSGDGGPASAAVLNGPRCIAADAFGNVYFVDGYTRIRKISVSGTINTICGNGSMGFSGDGGPAVSAMFGYVMGLAADTVGNVYFVDASNGRVRKIDNSGIINTITGNGVAGFSGDGGPATLAQCNFNSSESWGGGVAADANGNVYIADYGNLRIRLINNAGIISTFAGTGAGTYSGDGGQANAAAIYFPSNLALDASGNVYIATSYHQYGYPAAVRVVNTAGVIHTVAGNGSYGTAGDGGLATAAQLDTLFSIAVSSCGNIFLPDNGRIREVSYCTTNILYVDSKKVNVFPNPAINNLTIDAPNELGLITMYNSLGEIVLQTKSKNMQEQIDVSKFSSGVYVVLSQGKYVKFIKE